MTEIFCILDCTPTLGVVGGEQVQNFACKNTTQAAAQGMLLCDGSANESAKVCGISIHNLLTTQVSPCTQIVSKTTCGAPTATIPCFKDVLKATQGSIPSSTSTTFTLIASSTPSTQTGQEKHSNSSSSIAINVPETITTTIPKITDAGNSSSIIGNGRESTSSSPASKQQGISSGAAAGIGIGGAIAGAVLAGMILLFLFGRCRKRRQQRKPSSFAGHLPANTSGMGRQQNGNLTSTKDGVIVTNLPQPAEDDAIIGELSRLRDSMKNHVQSFYPAIPVNPEALDIALLSAVATDTGVQTKRLQALLTTPASQILALRLCISWIILSRSDGRGPTSTSLLPEEAATVASLIAGIDYNDSNKTALAGKMKVISGSLIQGRPGQAHPLRNADLEHRIEQTASTANGFLKPFLDPAAATSKRLRNMESIVRRASKLAMLLFLQPSS